MVKVSAKGHKSGKRLTYRDLKHRSKRKNPKLNTQQIDTLSDKVVDVVMSQSEVFADTAVSNPSFIIRGKKGSGKGALLAYLKELILKEIKQYEPISRDQFNGSVAEIKSSLLRSKEPASLPEPLDVSALLKGIKDYYNDYAKAIKSVRRQLKNLSKRLITWSIKKQEKTRSIVQAQIKFIITPRLFGIYISEEDNNGLALGLL